MIAVIQTFVYPNAWVEHLVWGSILVFLIARGPGAFSVDHFLARHWLRARRTGALPLVAARTEARDAASAT